MSLENPMTFCATCARRLTRDGRCGCRPGAAAHQMSAVRPAPPPPPAAPPPPPPPVDVREQLRRSQANRTVGLVLTAVAAVVGIVAIPAMVGMSGGDAPGNASASGYDPGITIETPDTGTGYAPDTDSAYPEDGVPTEPTEPTDATEYPTDTATDTTEPTVDPNLDPATQLAALAAADLPMLRGTLDGAWVAQLSSKRVGMTVHGTRYDDAAILADHLALRTAYPDVRLVWSGDWVTFSAQDFWVTLVAESFATAEDANAWCDAQDIGRDDCYAKRLATTGGGDGNTKPR